MQLKTIPYPLASKEDAADNWDSRYKSGVHLITVLSTTGHEMNILLSATATLSSRLLGFKGTLLAGGRYDPLYSRPEVAQQTSSTIIYESSTSTSSTPVQCMPTKYDYNIVLQYYTKVLQPVYFIVGGCKMNVVIESGHSQLL